MIKGSGLGGTSLINANVAIVPDREVFEQFHWPTAITYDALRPYYQRGASRCWPPIRIRAPWNWRRCRRSTGARRRWGRAPKALDIVVNFTIDGANAHGVQQKPCIDCGNCVTGCNVRAKNTLYMNYLPMAKQRGRDDPDADQGGVAGEARGGRLADSRQARERRCSSESFTLDAGEIVLSAGSLNSTEILLRSEVHGLSVSPALGTKFNGNGDFFGLAYNGDYETDVLGYRPADHPGGGRFAGAGSEHRRASSANQRSCRKRSASPSRTSRSRARPSTRSRASSARFAARTRSSATRTRSASGCCAISNPDGPLARSERRHEPHHAVPGDGPGQRARRRSSSRRRGPSPTGASASPGTRAGSSRSSRA